MKGYSPRIQILLGQKALKETWLKCATIDNANCVIDMDTQSVIPLKETCLQVEMEMRICLEVVKAISIDVLVSCQL